MNIKHYFFVKKRESMKSYLAQMICFISFFFDIEEFTSSCKEEKQRNVYYS